MSLKFSWVRYLLTGLKAAGVDCSIVTANPYLKFVITRFRNHFAFGF